MQLDPTQLRDFVIRPTLHYLGEWTQALENLLLGTAAGESHFNIFSRTGKSVGLYHLSKQEHRHIWEHHLNKSTELADKVRKLTARQDVLTDPDQELCTNLSYATAMAWAKYHYCGINKLPQAQDLPGLRSFWLNHYHFDDDDNQISNANFIAALTH